MVVVLTSRGRKIFCSSFRKPLINFKIDESVARENPDEAEGSPHPKKTVEEVADEKSYTKIANSIREDEQQARIMSARDKIRRNFVRSRSEDI